MWGACVRGGIDTWGRHDLWGACARGSSATRSRSEHQHAASQRGSMHGAVRAVKRPPGSPARPAAGNPPDSSCTLSPLATGTISSIHLGCASTVMGAGCEQKLRSAHAKAHPGAPNLYGHGEERVAGGGGRMAAAWQLDLPRLQGGTHARWRRHAAPRHQAPNQLLRRVTLGPDPVNLQPRSGWGAWLWPRPTDPQTQVARAPARPARPARPPPPTHRSHAPCRSLHSARSPAQWRTRAPAPGAAPGSAAPPEGRGSCRRHTGSWCRLRDSCTRRGDRGGGGGRRDHTRTVQDWHMHRCTSSSCTARGCVLRPPHPARSAAAQHSGCCWRGSSGY